MKWFVLSGIFVSIIIVLVSYIFLIYRSIREIADELEEKINMDTNTLISVSSGNRAVRMLAARINDQLCKLRRERLRLQNGDAELKAAITNISHDLRTPLTAICGYLDLAEQETHTEKSQRYLAIIRERTETMRTLTEELFQYSVIVSTVEKLNFEPVSLNTILEQSLAGVYSSFFKQGIVPDIHIPETPIIRNVDKTALRRIFDNILNNAAKYSSGDLTVSLLNNGTIIFANTAEKLSSVQTEKLFERFFTVQTARESTGIGLSVARLLTEELGGCITAEYLDGYLHIRVSFSK